MKKKFAKGLMGSALAVLLAVSLLPMGALAAECKHPELTKGYCEDCDTQYAAMVDGTYYKSLKDAVKAAEGTTAKEAVLLCDLKNETVKLGKVTLLVEADGLTIEKCSISGEHPDQLLRNEGELTIVNSAFNNKKGDYALTNAGEALQLKHTELDGEIAQVRVESGVIRLDGAPVDGVLFVDARLPGVFAEGIGSEVGVNWVSNENGRGIFDQTAKSWRLSGNLASAVTVEDEPLVYTGKTLLPAITAELFGETLQEGTDYTVTVPAPASEDENAPTTLDPVDVGTYDLLVKGKGLYSGSFTATFEIVPATPVVDWEKKSDTVTYSGSPAALNVKAVVETTDGKAHDGTVTYSHRAAGSDGAYTDGLPTNAGKYEVLAAVSPFTNHNAAQTEQALELTVAPKTVTPVVEVPAVADGYRFNGAAITPVPVVKDGSTVIPAGEYTVSYENNVNVGSAKVLVTSKDGGNYTFAKTAGTFTIQKAAQAPMQITGAPASVTYRDEPIQLNVSGGSPDGSVSWSVKEGSSNVTLTDSGLLTPIGVGKVTVVATKAGGENYDPVSAEWTFEIARAPLTITKIVAEDKVFDGTKTVTVKSVQFDGVRNGDDVFAAVDGLLGEVSSSNAGTYNAIKITQVPLGGATAKFYQAVLPEGGMNASVKITKADLTAALESIEVNLPVGTETVTVDNLGGAMPADAGKLTFTNRVQTTGEGTQAIVLKWGVDDAGKLTAQVVNGKGGDRITFEVAVASENYSTAVVKVIVTIGSKEVDTTKLTVTPEGGELVYNGQAHKPAMTVKLDGTALTAGTDFDVKYPDDCTSAGEKEVTITFKGNYGGTATAKYTIGKAKLTVSGTKVTDKTYNGTTTANVVVGSVSGIVQGDDVKVTASGSFADKNSGTRTVTVTYKIEGKAAGNYVLAQETEGISGRITPVTTAQLNSGISGVTTSNATTDHRSALQNVINLANSALADTGLSSADKTNISNVKWNAENIIARIDTAAAAAATDSIRATKDITSENVEMDDKAALEKTKTDLAGALTNYSGNYTQTETQTLKNHQTRVDSALAVINRVQSAETLIAAIPDDGGNDDAVNSAANSYDGLSDYEKTLLSQEAKDKIDAAGIEDGEIRPTATPQQNISGTEPEDDTQDGEEEIIQLPMWIFWVAVLAAALIALAFVWSKIKERNEPNW